MSSLSALKKRRRQSTACETILDLAKERIFTKTHNIKLRGRTGGFSIFWTIQSCFSIYLLFTNRWVSSGPHLAAEFCSLCYLISLRFAWMTPTRCFLLGEIELMEWSPRICLAFFSSSIAFISSIVVPSNSSIMAP